MNWREYQPASTGEMDDDVRSIAEKIAQRYLRFTSSIKTRQATATISDRPRNNTCLLLRGYSYCMTVLRALYVTAALC